MRFRWLLTVTPPSGTRGVDMTTTISPPPQWSRRRAEKQRRLDLVRGLADGVVLPSERTVAAWFAASSLVRITRFISPRMLYLCAGAGMFLLYRDKLMF